MAADSIIVNVFRENLRRLRKLSGITQVDMAARLGVTQGAYSKLERGDFVPTIVTVAKVAESLGTQPSALLTPAGKNFTGAAS